MSIDDVYCERDEVSVSLVEDGKDGGDEVGGGSEAAAVVDHVGRAFFSWRVKVTSPCRGG